MARIIVAEDDAHISRVICLWLKRNGHEVIAAEDGARALELIRLHRPELLVTDVNMPSMDGLDLLRTVRDESLMERPAIVLTSRCDQTEIEARARSLGAVVHPKPFSPMRLMEAVAAALKGSASVVLREPVAAAGCDLLGSPRNG